MVRAYIGIGSNIGEREKNLQSSIEMLKEKCDVLKVSSLYETEPVGYKEQGWFLNCVVMVDTKLEVHGLLLFLQSIEGKLGRVREIKDGPRIIDLDLLFYGNEVVDSDRLVLPHPRLHERNFVLVPLNEIAPNIVHPILKKTISELLAVSHDDSLVKLYQKSGK